MISETATNMVASLHHCLTLFHQQEDVRVQQLKEEREKCRVLEESLNVLAKEHHQLELSVAEHISETGHIPKSLISEHDEYHDAFGDGGDGKYNYNLYRFFRTLQRVSGRFQIQVRARIPPSLFLWNRILFNNIF